MNPIFSLPEATGYAARVDHIFYGLLILSGVIMALVFTLVIVFAVRYRRGSRATRGPLPELINREFEVGWTSATLFLFVFLFWWASSADLGSLAAPAGALEVHVVAKQWMWKTQQPNGAREIDALHVPIGRPVRLVMTSQDVIHSFFIPAFRIKQDVLPGRNTELWFQPDRTGTFPLLCAEFCGTDHSAMLGHVVVMRQDDYAGWLSHQGDGDDLVSFGAKLFVDKGCAGCHAPGSAVRAPALTGLYRQTIPLADGRQATADDAYLRDSILLPKKDIAAGYDPIMPDYSGLLDDGEVQGLVAYIRSLTANAGGAND